jgi:hypothetical protein
LFLFFNFFLDRCNIGCPYFLKNTLFKEVNYGYLFAKPTNEFTLLFNLTDEILVLFHRLKSFERRTLDYVDKLMTDYSNRLEKFCVIIVSEDRDVARKIERLNAEDQMSRIIIPFSFDDLLRGVRQDQVIIERFKKFFFSKDLYDYSSPLMSDRFFFGRSQIVQYYFDKYSSSENAGLFGLRKIGKTSVLYALRRQCSAKDIPVIYIDCQSPDIHKGRWNESLQIYNQTGHISIRLASQKIH